MSFACHSAQQQQPKTYTTYEGGRKSCDHGCFPFHKTTEQPAGKLVQRRVRACVCVCAGHVLQKTKVIRYVLWSRVHCNPAVNAVPAVISQGVSKGRGEGGTAGVVRCYVQPSTVNFSLASCNCVDK